MATSHFLAIQCLSHHMIIELNSKKKFVYTDKTNIKYFFRERKTNVDR